ncbi:hypothetical protein V6N11_033841 [Hibiscus sabdariffa]|uniref:Uncharacterized protein n=1 Tax=Hibiscus sabdariffa TaxID=183260 RepID=A0ABR2S0W2_9ROSI
MDDKIVNLLTKRLAQQEHDRHTKTLRIRYMIGLSASGRLLDNPNALEKPKLTPFTSQRRLLRRLALAPEKTDRILSLTGGSLVTLLSSLIRIIGHLGEVLASIIQIEALLLLFYSYRSVLRRVLNGIAPEFGVVRLRECIV